MNENNLTVTIRDMMECREVRAFLQKQYIDEYAAPVISFCMNIPGPVKTNDNILHGLKVVKRQYYQHSPLKISMLMPPLKSMKNRR